MSEIDLTNIRPIKTENFDKSTKFIAPIKRILNESDISKWLESETFHEVFLFIQNLSVSVKGKDNDFSKKSNEVVDGVLRLLDEVDQIIDNNPIKIDEHISRFGKVEFKDFYKELQMKTDHLIITNIPQLQRFENDPCLELSQYFVESWGNEQRIDYGSGHELNFIAFLLILLKMQIFHEDDYDLIVLRIFKKYMEIMRKLQKIYWLEPAGSHGVWGLDDYHFLPFLFGASQLATHKHIKPKSIHNEDLVEMYYKKYMYFECIHFINSVKSNKLRWNSPMLDDISVVRTWGKVNEGMIKMYKVEVLSKLPIIQHFFFGEVLKAPEGLSNKLDTSVKHIHTNWGDCCGIKIPSAIGASEINKFKPMPFD